MDRNYCIYGNSCVERMRWNSLMYMCIVPAIDYRREDGRFLVSVSCVTISKPDAISSSETGVNPGIRSWKKHLYDWAQCQKAIGSIYCTKKWRAEILQPGLEFDNFKPWLKSGIFKCISWLNSSFVLGWWSEFSERGSEDLCNGTNVAFYNPPIYFSVLLFTSIVYGSSVYTAREYTAAFGMEKKRDPSRVGTGKRSRADISLIERQACTSEPRGGSTRPRARARARAKRRGEALLLVTWLVVTRESLLRTVLWGLPTIEPRVVTDSRPALDPAFLSETVRCNFKLFTLTEIRKWSNSSCTAVHMNVLIREYLWIR